MQEPGQSCFRPARPSFCGSEKKFALTEWIFPDPLCPEWPVSPGSAYQRLKNLLDEAGLPDIRFHDLRHTFATNALEHGMDIKTLSAIIGHVSSATTLNAYAPTEEACEQKLTELITKMKKERVRLKARQKAG